MTASKEATPFSVRTPEMLPAKDTVELFVDLFTQIDTIKQPGHAMLNGPRGCGKSMMFRFLLPDCQMLAMECPLRELPFFSVLVSLRNKGLNIPEIQRLADLPYTSILNEHFLTMFVASKLVATITAMPLEEGDSAAGQTAKVVELTFERLRDSGWSGPEPELRLSTAKELLQQLQCVFDNLLGRMHNLLRRLAFKPELAANYSGPVCGYDDLLVPLFRDLRTLPYMPTGPIYLLMDDADYLTFTQTRVLNTWVLSRSISDGSVKISTQFKYKTFQAGHGMAIEAPHDFTNIDVSDLYTTEQSHYRVRVEQIVAKRLRRAGIEATPEEFFPEDPKQREAIAKIRAKLRDEWPEKGRGNRPSDDVLRYARPIYIRSLGGRRKSTHQFSYAGFEQLVNISSGVVRYFLDTAAQMYSLERSSKKGGKVTMIRPSIQDAVVKDASDKIMFEEFDRLFGEEDSHIHDETKRALMKDHKLRLHNLIRVLGNIFYRKLISEDSERRVFSVAFSDDPDPEVLAIFELGVKLGFFHKSAIGNKEGTGRTALYVLTRRLAPHFRLDPAGFAGYLFVTSERLREGIRDPDGFLLKVKAEGVDKYFEERQLELFSQNRPLASST
jgi:hypothetical protein